jgi:uncharacterized protein YfaS (alpha-2-macroglobulin family)
MNRYYQAIAKANSTTNINDDIAAALQAGYLTEEEIRDPWGNRFNLQQTNSESRRASEQITYFSQPIKPNFLPYAFYLNFYGYTTSVLATTTATPTPDTQPFKGNVSITEEAVSTGNYGRVGGKITQKAQNRNAAVRNATIKLRNRQTNQISTALTDAGGSFQFPAVAAGSYDILIEAPGQAPTSYTPINLAARAEAYVEALLSNTTAVTPGKKLFQLSLNYPQLNKRQLRGVETELDVAGIQDGIVDGVIVGGVAGGVVGGVDARPLPEAPAAARPLARGNAANSVMAAPLQKTTSADKAKSEAKKDAAPAESATSSGGVDEGPRIRSYFPETLYVNPVVITDKQGRATLRIPLADSITTWRMTMLASTKKGALGSNTAGLRVFQDFFIDLDMPVALTQGDSVTIPVAVYNYLDSNQDVELTLKQEDWFVMENDTPVKQTFINASEVGAINYRIRANRLGKNTLTVTARLLNRNSVANGDGIAREIEVLPNGERQELVINDRLENTATKQVDIPANAIDDASKILVKFFPGPLSQVVDGLDGILQMPGGCFEQTSSSTYPNILVMDYMKTTKKITPEIQVKAEGFISQGYQRLVTFEVPGGGFSWFGQAPAHKILTSYGLLEFTDMSRVHEVDPRVIERTQRWLASKQKADGSWEIDKDGIAEGAINNFQRDQVRVASYIAWALAYSGYKGPEVARAKTYVEKNLTGQEDAYTLAITANFAQDYKQDPNWTQRVMDFLAAKAIREGDLTHWAAPEQTPTHGRGATAEVETTALAIQAIIKSNSNLQMATQAINYLNSKKDARGTWGSTQPTIQALKAMLLSQKKGGSGDVVGNVMVSINGRQAKQIKLNRDNNDLLHQVDLKEFTVKGNNRVQLQFQGQGTMLYQIVGRHFRSWEQASGKGLRPEAAEPLDINVQYDRTQLAQDEIVTSKVIVRNRLNKTVNMVMVDLGVPPGFEVLAEDIQKLVNTDPQSKVGNVTKFSITARQVIIYLDGLRPNQTLQLQYRLRAKYPLRAQAPVSRVYEYYNPAVNAVSTPKELVVVARKK